MPEFLIDLMQYEQAGGYNIEICGFFKLMIRDIHTIEAYFHRRWKSDPEAQTAQTDQTTMGDKPQALNGKERAE